VQGEDLLGTLRSDSPDASPPTPERRWPAKPRRETATSDVCVELGAAQLQSAAVRGSQSPESPGGSSGGEATGGATQEVPQLSEAAPAAEGIQPAGQRGSSEASQQLQALAHHLMDEVSQVNGDCNSRIAVLLSMRGRYPVLRCAVVRALSSQCCFCRGLRLRLIGAVSLQLRMELSKRVAEVSALEARVALQSDYIQQLEACVGQVSSHHCHAMCISQWICFRSATLSEADPAGDTRTVAAWN